MFNLCVLINSLTLGGAERISIDLYEEYKKQGINVVFACLEKNNFYKIKGDNVFYLSDQTGENESLFKKLLYLFIFALRLKRFIQKHQIPIVQSHIYRANYVNVIAKLLGSPHKTQVVNHGIVSRYKNENLAGWVNLRLIKTLYKMSDQLIFPSKGMMHDLKNLGQFNNEMLVINNPFDVEGILKLKDIPINPDDFVFDQSRKYLVAVGRLEKVKRFQDIIAAVGMLKKNGLDVELLILGDGPERANLQVLINCLDLQKNVRLLGRVENPFKYISRADILVSASEYEGFCNVIVEALISGTAVISTDCESGPREILAPDTDVRIKLKPGEMEFAQFGVLIPVGGPETLARAVNDLLEDQNRLADYSKNGLRRAWEFDKALISKKYINKLSELTKR